MKLPDLLHGAALEISSHKTRSFLTCLSLAIGIGAILFTFSATGGMNRRLAQATELNGPGRLQIEKKRGYKSKGLSPGLTYDDAVEIRRYWPDLFMVHPMVRRWSTQFKTEGFKSSEIVTWATTHEWARRDWVYDVEGRFLTEDDVRGSARVAVIIQPGGWVKKPFWAKWFPEYALEKFVRRHELLGRDVILEEHTFKIIGILHEPPRDKDPRWGHSSYGGDGNIIIPITAYHKYLVPQWKKDSPKEVDEIIIDTGDEKTAGPVMRGVEQLLKVRHRKEKDFEIRDWREIMAGRTKRMRERAMVVLAIGLVAILAGGIGIMNVTLATVFSRIREIGIRRALGATRGDIVSQFATEASVLGFFAGVIGTGLGFLAVSKLSPEPDDMLPLGIYQISLALVIAIGTGFLSSLFPAWKAASFDPVESLRYE
jgi:ABC-type antimicrobial peptide transport system permease subunit